MCCDLEKLVILGKKTKLDDSPFSGCNSLTIHAPTGSYAEIYAKENNIPFMAE